jgi:hypothetical protein
MHYPTLHYRKTIHSLFQTSLLCSRKLHLKVNGFSFFSIKFYIISETVTLIKYKCMFIYVMLQMKTMMTDVNYARFLLRQHIVPRQLTVEEMNNASTLYTLQGTTAKLYYKVIIKYAINWSNPFTWLIHIILNTKYVLFHLTISTNYVQPSYIYALPIITIIYHANVSQ